MKIVALLFLLFNFLFSNEKLDPISLQLVWLHQFQSAGFYVAQEKGFYKDVGLHVEIKEYKHGVNIIEDVLNQKSTYGVTRPTLVIDRNNQKDIVALMALYQSSPIALISTNPSIKHLQDLKNKKVMMTPDEASSVAVMAMLLSNNLKPSDFILQNHSFSINDLINHKTDAMASYVSNEPFVLNQFNIPYQIFSPKDYGFDFYEDILFTSGDEIRNHEERVRNFYSATKKGWIWAFENIEQSAKIIYEKYNSQRKSLEALIFEGNILKEHALKNGKAFGAIEIEKFEKIAHIYQLFGLLKNDYSIEGFIDPLFLSRKVVNIGVLDNRSDKFLLNEWQTTANYLSKTNPDYHFVIIPLSVETIDEYINKTKIDFVITNPLIYAQLEHQYGISRIATFNGKYKNQFFARHGSVVFTRADNNTIKSISDLAQKRIGAVDDNSFGGFLLGLREIQNNGVRKNDLKDILLLENHAAVLNAVLEKKIDAGILRTSVLEKMQETGNLNLDTIKVLANKKFTNFPFLTSTELFPEWAFASLSHTQESLSNDVLSSLIKTSTQKDTSHDELNWKAPLDYSKVHTILKELKLYPYEHETFTLLDVLIKYNYLFITLLVTIILGILAFIHIKKLNKELRAKAFVIETFNITLEQEVKDRTRELTLLSGKLRDLSNTDELTKIANRRYFFQMGEKYFYTAKRNHTELYILSLDIDFFKKVNDTYGHAAGDEILKLFCKTITSITRESNLFGRVGGEEFCVCVQNTNLEGASILAEKIRVRVQAMRYDGGFDKPLHVTVSIGISGIKEEDKSLSDIINRSDEALYKAKRNGRNQIQIIH